MYETKAERDALFNFTGKYTEVELLNKEATGFGWAVLVQDNWEGNRPKVVKLPNREAATRELLAEAEILAKIARYVRHPNLIALGSVEKYVLDWAGKKDDRWFIVLEFGGENLRRRLGRLEHRTGAGRDEYVYRGGSPLSADEVLRIGVQVADGLRALHEFEEAPGQHIVHRDIKPENILIDRDGTVRLADFGISKVVERITQSVSVAGTAPYLAPEYSRGRITAASDIYSLGMVLYEMATGRFPFTLPEDRFYQMPDPPHALNSQVPKGLSEVIMRALWWDPHAGRGAEEKGRYSRTADLLQDLRKCYSRLYPVPPQYKRVTDRPDQLNFYRDGDETVRIYLYDTDDPARCATALGSRVRVKEPPFVFPRAVFESEGTVGVVAPLVPEWMNHSVPGDAEPPAVRGPAVYPFLQRVDQLCEHLRRLHRLGIYHGFLTPTSARWADGNWLVDHLWLAPLVGLVPPESLFRRTEVSVGYLAPEVLRWETPPMLGSDIYGLAGIVYAALTGAPPTDPDAALGIARKAPPPAFRAGSVLRDHGKTVSRRLREIVARALSPDPTARHRSIDEFQTDLRACLHPSDMVTSLLADAAEYHGQGRVVEAYDSLDAAQRLAPGDPAVHHARAEIYFLEREFTWALRENTKALAVEPTPVRYFLHGQILHALERYDSARDMLELGLELDDCARGRHLLARCLESLGLHRRALEEYEKAAEMARTREQNPTRVMEIEKDRNILLSKRLGSAPSEAG
jgi:serine/threonine protein kinase